MDENILKEYGYSYEDLGYVIRSPDIVVISHFPKHVFDVCQNKYVFLTKKTYHIFYVITNENNKIISPPKEHRPTPSNFEEIIPIDAWHYKGDAISLANYEGKIFINFFWSIGGAPFIDGNRNPTNKPFISIEHIVYPIASKVEVLSKMKGASQLDAETTNKLAFIYFPYIQEAIGSKIGKFEQKIDKIPLSYAICYLYVNLRYGNKENRTKWSSKLIASFFKKSKNSTFLNLKKIPKYNSWFDKPNSSIEDKSLFLETEIGEQELDDNDREFINFLLEFPKTFIQLRLLTLNELFKDTNKYPNLYQNDKVGIEQIHEDQRTLLYYEYMYWPVMFNNFDEYKKGLDEYRAKFNEKSVFRIKWDNSRINKIFKSGIIQELIRIYSSDSLELEIDKIFSFPFPTIEVNQYPALTSEYFLQETLDLSSSNNILDIEGKKYIKIDSILLNFPVDIKINGELINTTSINKLKSFGGVQKNYKVNFGKNSERHENIYSENIITEQNDSWGADYHINRFRIYFKIPRFRLTLGSNHESFILEQLSHEQLISDFQQFFEISFNGGYVGNWTQGKEQIRWDWYRWNKQIREFKERNIAQVIRGKLESREKSHDLAGFELSINRLLSSEKPAAIINWIVHLIINFFLRKLKTPENIEELIEEYLTYFEESILSISSNVFEKLKREYDEDLENLFNIHSDWVKLFSDDEGLSAKTVHRNSAFYVWSDVRFNKIFLNLLLVIVDTIIIMAGSNEKIKELKEAINDMFNKKIGERFTIDSFKNALETIINKIEENRKKIENFSSTLEAFLGVDIMNTLVKGINNTVKFLDESLIEIKELLRQHFLNGIRSWKILPVSDEREGDYFKGDQENCYFLETAAIERYTSFFLPFLTELLSRVIIEKEDSSKSYIKNFVHVIWATQLLNYVKYNNFELLQPIDSSNFWQDMVIKKEKSGVYIYENTLKIEELKSNIEEVDNPNYIFFKFLKEIHPSLIEQLKL